LKNFIIDSTIGGPFVEINKQIYSESLSLLACSRVPMTKMPLDFSNIIQLIRENNSFALTTHVNPDGDALGSEIGMAEWLISIGKNVRIINCSPTPYNYTFLDTVNPIVEHFDEKKQIDPFGDADVIFVLDVNDPTRTRALGPFLRNAKKPIAVIDHHLNPKEFATEYYIDEDACSTGELIMRLIDEARVTLGGEISRKAAIALYAAIMTDTGSFKFPRTTSAIFRMCADLLDLGADPVAIYNEIYNTSPPGRLELIRDALNSLEYHYDGLMAYQCITQAQIKSAEATEDDVDGLVQTPFQVKGIVLSVFLLELKEGWKVSTRSKNDVSAALFAQTFGGNGHFHAAGAKVSEAKTLEEMKRAIIDNAGKILAEAGVIRPQAA
jgi:bifunctional oligoribonuclease and PAP phosphatase NrnA